MGGDHQPAVAGDGGSWLSEIFPLLYVILAVPAVSLLDRWFHPTPMAASAAGAVIVAPRDTFAGLPGAGEQVAG